MTAFWILDSLTRLTTGFGFSILRSECKKIPCFVLVALLFAFCAAAEAQQAKKMARIGYLSPQSGPPRTLATFKQALRELGWAEGKEIEFEYRYGGGNFEKLSELATELVRLDVDVIVGVGNRPPTAAKRATTLIPIVMVGVVDPVGNGLVASLARPGANVTGVSFDVTPEQAGKNLKLLKEAVPKISRLALLRDPNISNHIIYSREAERAAKELGVTVRVAELQARTDKGLEEALGAVINQRATAFLVTPYPFFADHRQQLINFAARNKVPAMYSSAAFVEDGGFMSYGPNSQDIWRRAAVYVDKILKGTKPSDLPVEQPKKFEMVINLKTAKQIGLTIPPNVLARADKVIR